MIEYLQKLIRQGLTDLKIGYDGEITLERSRHPEHGHFTTNIALVLSSRLRKPPLRIATEIRDSIREQPDLIEKVEIASPGFINFFIAPAAFRKVVTQVLSKGDNFGRNDIGKGRRVLVEFVSANPTGPLTVGHGRQAVLGDTVARILEWNGFAVDREYYYNDAGRQMRILGQSVYIRYRQLLGYADELTKEHYQGEYIREIARRILNQYGDKYDGQSDHEIFRQTAEEAVFADIRDTLAELDIVFNSYYNEKSLYEDGLIDDVLKRLAECGATYEKDGAVWFRAGEYGSGEDRVLWKSVVDEATYRLPDIAYHETKIRRGYDLLVDIFGADHHATYPDVLAGMQALGYDTDRIRVLIHQFVTLTRGGEKIKMSTRQANYVTLRELIEEVGKDVVRYFFVMRGMTSHLNFDLALAKTEGDENPVFYLQYAHARICSILRNARVRGFSDDQRGDLSLLGEEETIALLTTLGEFSEVCLNCGGTLEPQPLTSYLHKLAATFHKFYTVHRVISKNRELSEARLDLVRAVRIVLANGLRLLGISAPERM